MTDKPAATKHSNVAFLDDHRPDAEYIPVSADQAGNCLLESFLANPRFSVPANDETATVKAAPVRQDCRDAKLLSMWIEILIEEEVNRRFPH